MPVSLDAEASDWAASAIEGACRRAEEWYRSLEPFDRRPIAGEGAVVGHKYPALLSERDCVIHFARFLNEEGVPWEAIHHELSIARSLFDADHPAATRMTPEEKKRRIDLVLVKQEELRTAKLPATKPGDFQFDAVLEFGYLSDFWTVTGAVKWGYPGRGKKKVMDDVAKVSLHLEVGACRLGYVVVFEDCDYGFEETLAADAEANHHGCRVRFIRAEDRAAASP